MSSSDDDVTLEEVNHSESGVRKSQRQKISTDPKRNSRHNRRIVKSHSEAICPVCDLTLRPGDIDLHYEQEYHKLAKILKPNLKLNSGLGRLERAEDSPLHSEQTPVSIGLRTEATDDTSRPSTSNAQRFMSRRLGQRSHHQEFRRVKVNRLARRQCSKWRARDIKDETVCPACQEPVPVQSPEELLVHVHHCLDKQQGGSSSDEVEVDMDDVEGDEYEWCGMKKIRLTSLMRRGQLHALGTMISKGDEEGDVDVCDESEGEELGPPQYFQEDLDAASNHCSNTIIDEETRPMGPSPDYDDGDNSPHPHNNEDEVSAVPVQDPNSLSQEAVVAALRMKIGELEEKGSVICHVCHGPYIMPVVSTVCWHVYCEKCWIQALATQKLCPQCKYIVSPTSLRRIYL